MFVQIDLEVPRSLEVDLVWRLFQRGARDSIPIGSAIAGCSELYHTESVDLRL